MIIRGINYMIKNSLRKNQDDSTNYLMNIIKTIYY